MCVRMCVNFMNTNMMLFYFHFASYKIHPEMRVRRIVKIFAHLGRQRKAPKLFLYFLAPL